MTKLTMKDFLNLVIEENQDNEVITEYAKSEIIKIEERAAKAAERNTDKNAEKDKEAKEAFEEIFAEKETIKASEAATMLDVSVQKASAMLRRGVKMGVLSVTDGKVKEYKRV